MSRSTSHHPPLAEPGAGGTDAPEPVPHDVAEARTLDEVVALAFAPIDKLAFGVALGCAAGLLLFLVTAARLLWGPPESTELGLLAQLFYGYTESWTGAFVALGWGFAVGGVAGWFGAFLHNFIVAVWLLIVRTRANFAATRDFLDHI